MLSRANFDQLFLPYFEGLTHMGCAETGGGLCMKSLLSTYPDARHIVIRNTPEASLQSLMRAGLPMPSRDLMYGMQEEFERLVREHGALAIDKNFSILAVHQVLDFLGLRIPSQILYERMAYRVCSTRFDYAIQLPTVEADPRLPVMHHSI
jgi:hypothetical protein